MYSSCRYDRLELLLLPWGHLHPLISHVFTHKPICDFQISPSPGHTTVTHTPTCKSCHFPNQNNFVSRLPIQGGEQIQHPKPTPIIEHQAVPCSCHLINASAAGYSVSPPKLPRPPM